MAHYLPTGLAPSPIPLLCALGECARPIPMGPLPPAFSLLKAESAMLNPSRTDVRIYFCSGEHRDQYWKQEQGWLDRQVAMPSERALTGPMAFNRFPLGGKTAFESMMAMHQGPGPWMSPMNHGLLPPSQPVTPVLRPIPMPMPMPILGGTPMTPHLSVPWTPPFLPRPGW